MASLNMAPSRMEYPSSVQCPCGYLLLVTVVIEDAELQAVKKDMKEKVTDVEMTLSFSRWTLTYFDGKDDTNKERSIRFCPGCLTFLALPPQEMKP